MSIPFNSSGLPKGTGSLQVRGRAYWMIYTDETGRKMQENTYTSDVSEARVILARMAIYVLKQRLAALEGVVHEAQAPAAGSRRDHPAAGDSRSRTDGKKPAKAASARGAHTRQGSPRKGAAA